MTVIVHFRTKRPALRNRLRRLLNSYGYPIQPGLYELLLRPLLLRRMLRQLKAVRYEKGDSVRVYKLCRRCRSRALYYGDARPARLPDYWIA
jgi:CRISPR-associated endonuclease Cas2